VGANKGQRWQSRSISPCLSFRIQILFALLSL
jgi:hypothetical protein